MKVLLISANAPPIICGIGDYTEILSKYLNSKNIQSSHLGLQKYSSPRFLKGLRILLKVRKALQTEKFDLIHLQYEAFSIEQSYLLIYYLTHLREPLVVTFHEVFQKTKNQIWRDRTLLKKAAAVIVNDQGRLESILQLWPMVKEKLHCLWVGSNLPLPGQELPLKRFMIGYFGFINGVKRLDILMESFKIIKQEIPKACLRLIGAFDKNNSEVKKWQQWADREGFVESIDWSGPQSRIISSQKIQECELMLLPFSDGASPRRGSLQAALFLGKAILASAPVLHEPDLEGLTFVKSNAPKDWAQQAIAILKDQNLRQELEGTSLSISQKFSWEKMAEKHLQIYLQVLKPKNGPS